MFWVKIHEIKNAVDPNSIITMIVWLEKSYILAEEHVENQQWYFVESSLSDSMTCDL